MPPVPASGGGVVPTPLFPQVPLVAPAGMLHGEPAQQSAVVVHAPLVGTHASAEQTKPAPAGFGTQGLLQQSALVAHAVPAGGGPDFAQS